MRERAQELFFSNSPVRCSSLSLDWRQQSFEVPEMQISSRFFNKALNLNHTVIHSAVQTTRRAKFGGVGFEQNVIEVNGRPNLHWQHKCPYCMQTCSVSDHQSGSVSWRTGTFNGEPVYLVYEPARISCPEHGVLREYLPWVCGRSWFTLDFCMEVAWAATVMRKARMCPPFIRFPGRQ